LFGGEDFPDRKLAFKPESRDVRLSGLKFLQPNLEVNVAWHIGIDSRVQGSVGFAQFPDGLLQLRPTLKPGLLYLLNLVRGQSKRRQQVRAAPLILPSGTLGRSLTHNRQRQKKQETC
jgi:hypothetical protein